MKTITAPKPAQATDVRRLSRWLREQVMGSWGALDANFIGPAEGAPLLAVYFQNDSDPHTSADLTALLATFNPAWQSQAEIDTARDQAASDIVMPQLVALRQLSPADQVYALMGRMMAINDGASQSTVNGIINRATAAAYVMSKSEWSVLPAATKAWLVDELDMLASILQLVIVRLR